MTMISEAMKPTCWYSFKTKHGALRGGGGGRVPDGPTSQYNKNWLPSCLRMKFFPTTSLFHSRFCWIRAKAKSNDPIPNQEKSLHICGRPLNFKSKQFYAGTASTSYLGRPNGNCTTHGTSQH